MSYFYRFSHVGIRSVIRYKKRPCDVFIRHHKHVERLNRFAAVFTLRHNGRHSYRYAVSLAGDSPAFPTLGLIVVQRLADTFCRVEHVQWEEYPLPFAEDGVIIIHTYIKIRDFASLKKEEAAELRRIKFIYHSIITGEGIPLRHPFQFPRISPHSLRLAPDVPCGARLFYLDFPVQSPLAVVLQCWYDFTHSFCRMPPLKLPCVGRGGFSFLLLTHS